VAVLMLTPACDMACPYCGAEEGFRPLGQAEAEGLLPALRAQGFESVVLGGGEPLCWQGDLRALAGRARSLGLETQVGSNLRRLPPGAESWPEIGRWILPLESALPQAHDALRPGLPSHHGVVLAALERFRLASRGVTLSSVARLDAEQDLHSVAALLRRERERGLRLHAWHVYRFQAMGRGGRPHAGRFWMEDGAWAALARHLKQRHGDLPLLLRPDMLHSREVAFFWGRPQGLWRQGPLGWSGLASAKALSPV
jgi:MoaA/NifB/PqqE/SkfB family radical SAM enzyme